MKKQSYCKVYLYMYMRKKENKFKLFALYRKIMVFFSSMYEWVFESILYFVVKAFYLSVSLIFYP